jgi:hypothetical protein
LKRASKRTRSPPVSPRPAPPQIVSQLGSCQSSRGVQGYDSSARLRLSVVLSRKSRESLEYSRVDATVSALFVTLFLPQKRADYPRRQGGWQWFVVCLVAIHQGPHACGGPCCNVASSIRFRNVARAACTALHWTGTPTGKCVIRAAGEIVHLLYTYVAGMRRRVRYLVVQPALKSR